jgi:hypothetical protein
VHGYAGHPGKQGGGQEKNNRKKWMAKEIRVTRLGEFLPFVRLFSLGSFWEITEVAQIYGVLFPQVKLCINFDKKMFGLHFGRLFHKLIWSP